MWEDFAWGILCIICNRRMIGNDQWKSFHILNCESLESIQIGEYSFSDFAGEFELKNLPQLQSIQIGTFGSHNYNPFKLVHLEVIQAISIGVPL